MDGERRCIGYLQVGSMPLSADGRWSDGHGGSVGKTLEGSYSSGPGTVIGMVSQDTSLF